MCMRMKGRRSVCGNLFPNDPKARQPRRTFVMAKEGLENWTSLSSEEFERPFLVMEQNVHI